MNFLIKLEEAINNFLEKLFHKLKELIPSFIFSYLHFIKHIPSFIKLKLTESIIPKIRHFFSEYFGALFHGLKLIRGHFTAVLIYLRSEEFKKADKKQFFMKPFLFARLNPVKVLSFMGFAALIVFSGALIFSNTSKIITGTKALRKPASVAAVEEDLFLNFKDHKFEVHVGGGGGGHGGGHGGGGEAQELEMSLDIQIKAHSPEDKLAMEKLKEFIDDTLEGVQIMVTGLPLTNENQKEIEKLFLLAINENFKLMGYKEPVQSVHVKQKLSARPVYYKQQERMYKVENLSLQLFLEDTHRNKQVWMDFSLLASNRNIIMFLNEHEAELKDHITTNVEPVIPQLPLEEEGRQIIKEKMRSEINDFLKKHDIEGSILEIYIDYLMVS